MFKEFKTFVMQGNVMDLAVGVIIGAAFGKIVDSAVNDLIMPVIGLFMGKVDFNNLYINLSGTDYPTLAAAKEAGAATINYGTFINTSLDFLIMALVIFMLVRTVNRIRAAEAPAAPEPEAPPARTCPFCKSELHMEAVRCPYCTSEL